MQPNPRKREPKLRREMAAAQERAFTLVGAHAGRRAARGAFVAHGRCMQRSLAAVMVSKLISTWHANPARWRVLCPFPCPSCQALEFAQVQASLAAKMAEYAAVDLVSTL